MELRGIRKWAAVALCAIPVVFGALLGVIATYRGYTSPPHAMGVSRSTTSAVVTSSVWLLLTDYVITAFWGV